MRQGADVETRANDLGAIMSTQPNGLHHDFGNPARRLRFDDLTSVMSRHTWRSDPVSTAATAEMLPRGHSGRRFVLVAGLTAGDLGRVVLDLPGLADEIPRTGRVRGIHVVPAIDRLEAIVPANATLMHGVTPCDRPGPC